MPTLREIMAERFDAAERTLFASAMRPLVETSGIGELNAIAYLTAVKPR